MKRNEGETVEEEEKEDGRTTYEASSLFTFFPTFSCIIRVVPVWGADV